MAGPKGVCSGLQLSRRDWYPPAFLCHRKVAMRNETQKCRSNVPFFDESCGSLAALSTRSFPMSLGIELPTSGQLSLSPTGGIVLGGCELRGLTTKGSSFSAATAGAPFVGEMERNDTATSRNPELVFGSRSCDAKDGGGSVAGGIADDRCVA